jgi:hypothetical protein
MPLKGPNFGYGDNDGAVTRAKPVHTPGVGTKYKDPIRGRQPDQFFAVGDQFGQDIGAKLDREANRRKNGAGGR